MHTYVTQEKPCIRITEATLDISSDTHDRKLEVLKLIPHGIPTHTYFPSKKCKIVGVVDKALPIWSPASPAEHCTKVTVCSTDAPILVHVIAATPNAPETALYFVKVRKTWKKISVDNFYSLFDKLALNKSVVDYLTLNINSPLSKTQFIVNTAADKPYQVVVPAPGYVLSRVFDGINTIWKSSSYDEHCTYVNIFHKNKKPSLLHLVIAKKKGHQMLFFRKVTLSWKQITKAEYLQAVNADGLNLALFNNHITLDYTHPDMQRFRVHRTYNVNVLSEIFTPLPGYSLTRVVDTGRTVWESNTLEQCVFVRFYSRDRSPVLCHLLVTDSAENKIVYFMKTPEKWTQVDKKTFLFFLSNKDDPIYTHRGVGVDARGNRKLLMSHFRNKQGLMIRTYCCTVDNPKGNIILVHGSWGHFKSQFCTYDIDWHYEHFGYPILPYVKDFTTVKMDSFYRGGPKPSEVYRDLFGWDSLDGKDAFDISPRFQYNGTFLESLNNMGYNVYGMDAQSHGLSESLADNKFYINDFKDYVNDLLQFVDIVKRGKFESTNESWNEDFVYSVSSDNVDLKCYLSGFSLGGNIAIQAVQEFYKRAKHGVKFVDGVFILSGMLNIDNSMDTFAKKFTVAVIKFISLMTPRSPNPLESAQGFSDSIEMFSKYKDPTYYTERLFFKTVEMLFAACKEVFKNMKYYPDNLPTLFIHVSEDPLCDVNVSLPHKIQGQRNIVYNYLKDKSDVKLVELQGNSHHLVLSHFFPNVMPIINDWFLSYSSKSSHSPY